MNIWGMIKKQGVKLSVKIPLTKPLEYPPDDKINVSSAIEAGILKLLLKKALPFLKMFPVDILSVEEREELEKLKGEIPGRIQ